MADGLHDHLPDRKPCEHAWVLKLTTARTDK